MKRRIEAKPAFNTSPHDTYNMQMDKELTTFLQESVGLSLAESRKEGKGGWWTPYCHTSYLTGLMEKYIGEEDYIQVAVVSSMLAYRKANNIGQDDPAAPFNEDGSLVYRVESYFNNEGQVDRDILNGLHKYPAGSDAAKLRYLSNSVSSSDTHYSKFLNN